MRPTILFFFLKERPPECKIYDFQQEGFFLNYDEVLIDVEGEWRLGTGEREGCGSVDVCAGGSGIGQ